MVIVDELQVNEGFKLFRQLTKHTAGLRVAIAVVFCFSIFSPAHGAVTLTVNNGSGSGNYIQGKVVNIVADQAPSANQVFDKWVGDISVLADPNSAKTKVTIPTSASGQMTIVQDFENAGEIGEFAGANYATKRERNREWGIRLWKIQAAEGDRTGLVAEKPNRPGNLKYKSSNAGIPNPFDGESVMVMAAKVMAVNPGTGSTSLQVRIEYAPTENPNPAGFGIISQNGGAVHFVLFPERAGKIISPDTLPLNQWYDFEMRVTPHNNNWFQATGSLFYRESGTSNWIAAEGLQDIVMNYGPTRNPTTSNLWRVLGAGNGVAQLDNYSFGMLGSGSASSVTVAATYKDKDIAAETYSLTVTGGSGGGLYEEGQAVSISANKAPNGKAFDVWTGNTVVLTDPISANTIATMLASDATVKANYKTIAPGPGSPTGGLIPSKQLTVTAFSSAGRAYAINAVNGAGLTGDVHNGALNHMWLSKNYEVADKWIKIDLGGLYDLDHLKVWNYNVPREASKGVRLADIWVAEQDPKNNINNSKLPFNSEGWTRAVMDHQFVKSPGGAITDTDSNIDLRGYEARCVLIHIKGNHGASRGDVGLSEVQIFTTDIDTSATTYTLTVTKGSGDGSYTEGRAVNIAADKAPNGQMFDVWTGDTVVLSDPSSANTIATMLASSATVKANYKTISTTPTIPTTPTTPTTPPTQGGLIPSKQLTVTAFSSAGRAQSINAVNGAGLTSNQHNGVLKHMWLSKNYEVADKWIKIDLGGLYDLDHLRVWNYNVPREASKGIRLADIWVAKQDPKNNVNNSKLPFNSEGWTRAVVDYQFVKSPGGAITATDGNIDLSGYEARCVLIHIKGNHGASRGDVGLSEMQIFTTDTDNPATTYPLTVTKGSGDGLYSEGRVVNIAADKAPNGQVFDVWTGDTVVLSDPNSANTTATMLASSATVKANYKTISTTPTTPTTPPTQGGLIPPEQLTVTAFSSFSSAFASKAVNGAGLTGDLHNNVLKHMWLSKNHVAAGKWLKIGLGGRYKLDHLRVWNYNVPREESMGIQLGDIWIAKQDPKSNVDNSKLPFDQTGWTPAVLDHQFVKSPGRAISPTDGHINMNGVEAAYVLVHVRTNHGASRGDVGLSEVQIFATDGN